MLNAGHPDSLAFGKLASWLVQPDKSGAKQLESLAALWLVGWFSLAAWPEEALVQREIVIYPPASNMQPMMWFVSLRGASAIARAISH